MPQSRETFPPVTMGHIRSHGVTRLLVYCHATECNHSAKVDADALPDDVPVRSLCPRMVCTRCGLIGAARPAAIGGGKELRLTESRQQRRR
jgi:hypothetical protein